MTSIATTWGISSPQFLWLYGGLCAIAAAAIWLTRMRALGAAPRSKDPTPDLEIAKIAMLSGGTQLAITTAATKLHRDGVLRPGAEERTLVVDGDLPAGADRLERAVYEAVRHEPGISVDQLRAELADSEPIQWMNSELTEVGLLVDEDKARRLRRLWLWLVLIALFGAVRIYAGVRNDKPIGYLTIMVLAVVVAAVWLARRPTRATARGSALVRAHRQEHEAIRRAPTANESVLAIALFGGAALWLADPGIASTLDVPRENRAGWGGDGGGSYGCSAGGGGWFGGGDGGGGSSCGGGGGGCGGGGGG